MGRVRGVCHVTHLVKDIISGLQMRISDHDTVFHLQITSMPRTVIQ